MEITVVLSDHTAQVLFFLDGLSLVLQQMTK